jgi:hypothetical protein
MNYNSIIDILDYENYKIQYINILYKEKFNEYENNYKIRIYFNHEIKESVLSDSLTHLIFDLYFNQEIKENVLPQSLTHLASSSCY